MQFALPKAPSELMSFSTWMSKECNVLHNILLSTLYVCVCVRLIPSDAKWNYLLTNIGPIMKVYWMMNSGNLTSKYPTYCMCINGLRINRHASNLGLGTFQHTECDVVSH